MMDLQGQLQLLAEAGPTAPPSGSQFLVPIHADNWALSLASGYLGSPVRSDQAEDLQSIAGGVICGFRGAVPRWAMEIGDRGPRVVVSLPASQLVLRDATGVTLSDSPVRATLADAVLFPSEEALADFRASYGAFPDVPVDLIPMSVGIPVSEEGPPSPPPHVPDAEVTRIRRERDVFAGWAAGAFLLVAEGSLDGLLSHLAAPAHGLRERAGLALASIDSETSDLDQAIWAATLDAIIRRRSERGFDRSTIIGEVESTVGEPAARWADVCRRVVNAERDLPSLDDSRNIGRRAAIALILAHDPQAALACNETLGAGPRVKALAVLGAHAFHGLSRLGTSCKAERGMLDAVLRTGEALAAGAGVEVAIGEAEGDSQPVLVSNTLAFRRPAGLPPALASAQRLAEAAGFVATPGSDRTHLVLRSGGGDAAALSLYPASAETSTGSTRLVAPLGGLGATKPTMVALKSALSLAWQKGIAVGLQGEADSARLVAFQIIEGPLDELRLRLEAETLSDFAASLLGRRQASQRVRKPAARSEKKVPPAGGSQPS